MGTRAAAFTAKIHNLQHYNARIQTGLLPLPSGDDVANTLKYFSQTLLSVLKDVPSISLEMLRSAEKDDVRTALFPSLDYKGLFHAIVELVSAVALVQHGAHALGSTILQTLACLTPFIEHEYMDTLPYLLASSMTLFPCSLHKDIVDMLCKRLLPFTFNTNTETEGRSYANMSTAAILMMVFQYTDCSAHHCQVLECFMTLKKDVVKDLLSVIAHGTAKARGHAVELLFQYLPSLNPALLDRKGIGWLLDSLCTLTCLVLFPTFSPSTVTPSLMPTGSSHTGWKPLPCQRETCQSILGNEAVKMCFNHSIAIGSGEQPPPLYVCKACAEEITKEYGPQHMTDVLLPMDKVSVTCENPDCKSTDKSAVATCFSPECANINNHRPIRFCANCVILYHNEEQGTDHMIHTTVPSPWSMDLETQSYMVEAVVSLLREAEPLNEKHIPEINTSTEDVEESTEINVVEERQLLSRYGIWLLVGLGTPTDTTPHDSLGRLLSMLFQWFHYTACLPDDQAGNALERLKAEYIHGWLMEIVKSHFDVFVSCLLPHPADCAKVGGHWETWPSYTNQIKEGFKRLLCLVPYDIITLEVWEYIMPFWMESFRHEAMETEFSELKILLSKVLDPDLSPLGFNTKQMYKFLSVRFENCSNHIQEQALCWLQILTMLEVPVPLELLFDMFTNGIESTKLCAENKEITSTCHFIPPASVMHRFMFLNAEHFRQQVTPESISGLLEGTDNQGLSDTSLNLCCYILMLDIMIKQLELQEISAHRGLKQEEAQNVMLLMRDMLKVSWVGIHTCTDSTEGIQCTFCEICAIWFQLCLLLIEFFSPVMEVTMADVTSSPPPTEPEETVFFPESAETTKNLRGESVVSETLGKEEEEPPQKAVKKAVVEEVELGEMASEFSPIRTASVQEFGPTMDTVSIIPTEDVVTAVANEVTLTDDDVARAKCTVASPILMGENDQSLPPSSEDPSFWETAEGKFKFTIEELPPQQQLLYALLKSIPNYEDADVLYHILSCLKVMCLHSEILNKAASSQRGFVIWCQENLLITNLWKLLQGEFSHIAQLATYLILHCVTLPCGSDVFWKTLEKDFHSSEWKVRYAAVEKVTMVAHFFEPQTVKNSPLLQAALANAFCYLVHCLDDIQPTVSQRALLNLETIKTTSLKLFVWCLEVQFDCNLVDRPMILQTISQIHNHISNRRFLSWDFFLTRFDTLFLEAQVILERTGDVTYIRDLKNSNTSSEMFQKKLKRAHDALSLLSSSRSLTASLGAKWPYQRALSAPGAIFSRQEKFDKEKFYERQSSAPVLKRKSSGLIGSTVASLAPLQHFPNSFFTDSHLKETMQEESQFLNVLHRAMDLEEHDRETLHLLIYLLMQFLSRPDPVLRSEDKVSRSQHMVLRHLNILLGYSQTQNEGKFLIPPHKVRASAAFNAFLMSMPKVLDYNFSMASAVLGTCLSLLVCCPAPQKYPNEQYPPLYTIWLLDAHCRHAWLLSALVILYKYHYDSYPLSRHVQWLITIVLNTLKAQKHKCKLSQDSLLSPLPFRSRDFSTTPSADIEIIHDREKESSFETGSIHEELIKPFIGSGMKLKGFGSKGDEMILEQIQKTKEKGERYQWKSWKASDRSCSSDGEDAEPELEAIPESPKSEGSLHEPFTSEFSVPHALRQACVQLVQDLDDTEEHVVITDPWSKMTAEATLVSVENQQKASEEPQNSESCDTDSSHIIEKSAIESMEKQILQPEVKSEETPVNRSALENLAFKNVFSEHNVLEGRHSMPCRTSDQNFKEQFSGEAVKPIEQSFEITESKPKSETCINSNKDKTPGLSQWKEHMSFNQSLSLPDTEIGGKTLHSKYPHPKLFHSKKKDAKAARKAEMLGSVNLTSPLFRPPLERLLPIGMPRKADTPTSPTSPMVFPFHHSVPSHNQQLQHSSSSTTTTGYSINRELCEDKAVQAGGGGLPFELPPPERLLPIGPPPSRKEWFYAPIFKTSFSESMEGAKVINPQMSKFGNEHFPSLSESVDSNEPSNILMPLKPEVSKNCAVIEPLCEDKQNNNKFLRQENVTERNEKDVMFEALPKSKSQPISVEHNNLNKDDRSTDGNQAPPLAVVLKAETVSNYEISNSFNSVFEKNGKEVEELTKADFVPAAVFESDSVPIISSIAEMLQGEKAEIVGFSSDYDVNLKHADKAASDDEVKCKLPYRQRKQRKPGLSSLEAQRSFDYQNAGIRRMRKVETGSLTSSSLMMKRSSTCQGSPRFVEDTVVERCTECGTVLEEYSDEELGLCVVILATFVHREPAMAAPFLPKMLKVVSRIASTASYPWQSESNVHLPGGSVSVARQFLRCTLHQLAPNGIFSQIFQSHLLDAEFFKTMAAALADFSEVNQVTPLLHVFENLNEKKHLHQEMVFLVLDNVATYLDCLPLESNIPPWCMFLQQLDIFFRKLLLVLPIGPCQLSSILHIMLAALKVPVINSAKSLLDPFSKLLSHAIQHSELDYQQVSDLCRYCYRNVAKERDKLILTRTTVFELVQALKFKSSLPDANLLILVQFVLEDAGGTLGSNIIVDGFPTTCETNMFNTSSSECMRQYLNDALEFVADVHTLNKVKNMLYGSFTHLNEETLGGQLKAGIAQYLAIEISKGNGRDNRAIGRYLPWLYHPPTVLQQGPKEFIDCVSHIRLLSWLLLGALTHSCLLQNTSTFNCQPVPLEANSHIAEHIQMILTGFADQSKVSVLHMSSLFHAFILCQLWTMYCEHMVALNPPGSEQSQICSLTLTDFWAKVTPGILQLVCHSKIEEQPQLAEMVSLHFLSLLEALMECNSTILARLLPMWTPVLYSFQGQLPANLHVRLRNCISCQPPSHTREDVTSVNTAFLRWLQRLQFKMGQIELQSSTVAQFYTL